SARAVAFSVGVEPTGTPADVLDLGGGPPRFLRVLADQLERRRRGDVPAVDDAADWSLLVEPEDPRLQRVEAALLTLGDGRLGTRGQPLRAARDETPAVLYSGVHAGSGPATEPAGCPHWTDLGAGAEKDAETRRLDLRTGLL